VRHGQCGKPTFYFAANYRNVALQDKDGALRLNPEVKRVGDAATVALPELKASLEGEFRTLLGDTPAGFRVGRESRPGGYR
jgi:hypothetical protein